MIDLVDGTEKKKKGSAKKEVQCSKREKRREVEGGEEVRGSFVKFEV